MCVRGVNVRRCAQRSNTWVVVVTNRITNFVRLEKRREGGWAGLWGSALLPSNGADFDEIATRFLPGSGLTVVAESQIERGFYQAPIGSACPDTDKIVNLDLCKRTTELIEYTWEDSVDTTCSGAEQCKNFPNGCFHGAQNLPPPPLTPPFSISHTLPQT